MADWSETRTQGMVAVPQSREFFRPETLLTRDQQALQAKVRRGKQLDQEAAKLTVRAVARATATAQQVQRGVASANARIEELNGRARDALVRAAGTDCGETASAWWKWWKDCHYAHYDLEKPNLFDKKKLRYEHVSANIDCQHLFVTSCFPRGTVVWTLTGPAAIEKIKVGDRVLSQHPVSGELAYKPVIQTTTRKPESWARVSLGPEVITATRGHAFLVAGEGWKMAKQLKVGMRLHTPAGSVVVDGLEEVSDLKPFYERLAEKLDADAGDDLAYNLVVDEFHTYFVGSHRVLVFDNLFAAMANQLQTAAAPGR